MDVFKAEFGRPEFPPFEVPYLCASSPYDGLGFEGFPKRKGYNIHDQATEHVPVHVITKDAKFLQAWLFFGAISEVSAISGLEIETSAEFLKSKDNGLLHVWTEGLNGFASRIIKADSTTQEPSSRHQRCQRVCTVFKQLYAVVSRHDRGIRDVEGILVVTSIKVLCRVLLLLSPYYSGVETTMPYPGTFDICAGWNPSLKIAAELDMKSELNEEGILLSKGWCPMEVRLVQECYQSMLLFFATTIERPVMNKSHENCTEMYCLAETISEEQYQTVHVTEDCGCKNIEIDGDSLAKVLQEGHIPRITIRVDGSEPSIATVTLTVVDDLSYMTISHVWAHGLGNPHTNSLPTCQILRLHGYLQQNGQEQALWMDTLCIPVAPSLREWRNKAIVLLAKTYAEAGRVLVVDRELQAASGRQSTLETVVRILCCGWQRRLWTLQEGSLGVDRPGRLYFQFLEGPLSFAELDPAYNTVHDPESEAEWEYADITAQLLYHESLYYTLRRRMPPVRALQQKHPSSKLDASNDPFGKIIPAVTYRATSHARDEPICMASLLGFDVAALLQHKSLEDRLREFYIMLHRLPSDILFIRNTPKMALPPFRWAPTSILACTSSIGIYSQATICDTQGLHITNLTGFLFSESCGGKLIEDGCFIQDRDTGKGMIVNHSLEELSFRETLDAKLALRRGPPSKRQRLPVRPAMILNKVAELIIVVSLESTGHGVDTLADELRGTVAFHLQTNFRRKFDQFPEELMAERGGNLQPDGPEPCDWLTGRYTERQQRWCVT